MNSLRPFEAVAQRLIRNMAKRAGWASQRCGVRFFMDERCLCVTRKLCVEAEAECDALAQGRCILHEGFRTHVSGFF
jgi:hypothetical protein